MIALPAQSPEEYDEEAYKDRKVSAKAAGGGSAAAAAAGAALGLS